MQHRSAQQSARVPDVAVFFGSSFGTNEGRGTSLHMSSKGAFIHHRTGPKSLHLTAHVHSSHACQSCKQEMDMHAEMLYMCTIPAMFCKQYALALPTRQCVSSTTCLSSNDCMTNATQTCRTPSKWYVRVSKMP